MPLNPAQPNQTKDYYYHFTPCEFFTLALADGLSMESK